MHSAFYNSEEMFKKQNEARSFSLWFCLGREVKKGQTSREHQQTETKREHSAPFAPWLWSLGKCNCVPRRLDTVQGGGGGEGIRMHAFVCVFHGRVTKLREEIARDKNRGSHSSRTVWLDKEKCLAARQTSSGTLFMPPSCHTFGTRDIGTACRTRLLIARLTGHMLHSGTSCAPPQNIFQSAKNTWQHPYGFGVTYIESAPKIE